MTVVEGVVRIVLMDPGAATVRGAAAEFRHVGATVVIRDDPIDALTEVLHDPVAVLVVSCSADSAACERVIELAVAATEAPVFLGLGAEVDEENIRSAFQAGARGTVALPLTPDRAHRMLRSLPVLPGDGSEERPVHAAGDLVLDASRHVATWRGETIDLPPQEFAALLILVRAYPYLATLDELAHDYLGERVDPYRAVQIVIRRMRNRLARSTDAGLLSVLSVKGVGYRLAC